MKLQIRYIKEAENEFQEVAEELNIGVSQEFELDFMHVKKNEILAFNDSDIEGGFWIVHTTFDKLVVSKESISEQELIDIIEKDE